MEQGPRYIEYNDTGDENDYVAPEPSLTDFLVEKGYTSEDAAVINDRAQKRAETIVDFG